MLYHYLLIAVRSFRKYKSYAMLNILGLSLGITCSLIIFLYVYDEWTFDHNQSKRESIYRLNAAYHLPKNGGFEQYATSGPAVGALLPDEYSEVKRVVRMRRILDVVVEKPTADERQYEAFFAADSTIFDVFTFPFLSGNPTTSLLDINTVVITRSAALRYFGRDDVIGEALRLPVDSVSLRITGVMADHPANTLLRPDFIISMETYRVAQHVSMQNWWNYSFYTFLELAPHASVAALSEKVKFISRKFIPDQEDGSGYHQEYSLIPLSDIHLHANLRSELEPNSKASYVYIFLVVGIFIVVIACINFMNLATARAAMRAKEIGLRKVAGAIRSQLVGQFLGEAFLLTAMAAILALGAVYFALPYINDLTGKSLHLFSGLFFWLAIFGIILFVALLAGSYPSLFLSAFRPAETLKGSFRHSARGNNLRRGLVVFQFFVSIFLISGTLIIIRQLNYLRAVDLGFDKEKMLVIPTRFVRGAAQDFALVKEELKRISGVTHATLSSRVPGREMGNNVVRLGWDDAAEWSDMRFLAVDHEFVEAYGLQLAAGRTFSKDFPSDDEQAFMFNESGVQRLGLDSPEKAIGQRVAWQDRKGMIIGVLKDFHFMSVNVAVEPFMVVMHKPWSVGYLSISIEPQANPVEVVRNVEETFHRVLPGRIFEYNFLDDEYDRQYKSEDRFMTIFSFFSLIAIVIACFGLYGLAMFMAELRFREIGIRKVLGATERSVVALMTKDFFRLVAVAFVLASPLAYWAMSQWLSGFPYREKIQVWLLVLSGVVSLAIAMVTISFQAWKAARTNPVRSLAMQ